MYRLLALLRLIHREWYQLGPGIVPAVLSKYRTGCAWLIALLCLATAFFDLSRGRRLACLLWTATGAILFAGFQSDAHLWRSSATVALGWAAIALAVIATFVSARGELRASVASPHRQTRPDAQMEPEAPIARKPG